MGKTKVEKESVSSAEDYDSEEAGDYDEESDSGDDLGDA
jgi:hypothetical protein